MTPRETRIEALRQIEITTSLAIDLLHDLDRARLQIRVLKQTEDGRMIVPPESLSLSTAVERTQNACKHIKAITKRQTG